MLKLGGQAVPTPSVGSPELDFSSPRISSPDPAALTLQPPAVKSESNLGFQTPLVSDATVRLPRPRPTGSVFEPFAPLPLRDVPEHHRRMARRKILPDDPFSLAFHLLLPRQNWDRRVLGLDGFLPAFTHKPYGEYQIVGMQFLMQHPRCLLADEMGLGKTVQAIMAMRSLVYAGRISRILVVAPKSLLENWKVEVEKWAPELAVAVVHGGTRDVIDRPHHVYITTYDHVRSALCPEDEQSTFAQRSNLRRFDLCVFDEVQACKNASTKRTRAVAALQTDGVWALTGTPIENRPEEYCTIWELIDPSRHYAAMPLQAVIKQTTGRVLRRKKAEVLEDLPAMLERSVQVLMDGPQLKAYRQLEQHNRSRAIDLVRTAATPIQARQGVLALLHALKQGAIADAATKQSAKIEWLQQFCAELHPVGKPLPQCDKALVFTQYPGIVCRDWKLHEQLQAYHPLVYDGSLSMDDRKNRLVQFRDDENCRLLFISLQAGATGLTLTRANHVVFLDAWWNPAIMRQAAARVHRIGQDKNCQAISLIAAGTIDERIARMLADKQATAETVMNQVSTGEETSATAAAAMNALTLGDLLRVMGVSDDELHQLRVA